MTEQETRDRQLDERDGEDVNWKRGLIRLWLILSLLWILGAAWILDPIQTLGRRNPQDDVAVALDRPAHRAELFDDGRLQPDEPIALGVDLGLKATLASGSVGRRRRMPRR
jgi:hypothetical protein